MRVEVHVDERRVREGLERSKRELGQGVKRGLEDAVKQHGLPAAKRLAPGHRIREALHAHATTRSAFIEVKNVPFAGLLEFGGTVRTVLTPKHAQALKTPQGPRAKVKRPRHYKARRYLQRAVEETRPAVERDAAERIAEVYRGAGLEVER